MFCHAYVTWKHPSTILQSEKNISIHGGFFRYTAWIPLYPAGFICEGVIALRDIPYFEETERFSVGLPNAVNFSFHFPSALRFYLLFLFFPMLYTMMNHMYHLRCKKLNIKQHARNKKKKDHDD